MENRHYNMQILCNIIKTNIKSIEKRQKYRQFAKTFTTDKLIFITSDIKLIIKKAYNSSKLAIQIVSIL